MRSYCSDGSPVEAKDGGKVDGLGRHPGKQVMMCGNSCKSWTCITSWPCLMVSGERAEEDEGDIVQTDSGHAVLEPSYYFYYQHYYYY